jgi:hypothetical protein
MLSTARASRDAAIPQEKTKQQFRNSSVGIVNRIQTGRQRYRGSIVGRGTFVILRGSRTVFGPLRPKFNGYLEVTQ